MIAPARVEQVVDVDTYSVQVTLDPDQVLTALAEAGRHRATFCDFCDGPVVEPVRDAEEVSWIGKGAATYCSQTCLAAHDEQRINAAGNEAS
jgi:hypothetical protein